MDTTSFPLGQTDPSDQVSTKAGALHLDLLLELDEARADRFLDGCDVGQGSPP
jgi:hypothetical protein